MLHFGAVLSPLHLNNATKTGFSHGLRRAPLPAPVASGLLSSCPLHSGPLTALTSCPGPPQPLLPVDLGPISTQPGVFSCRAAPACPRSLWILRYGLASHLDLGLVPSPWTCLTIVGLCPALAAQLRPRADPGLQNGFPPCLQTCHITCWWALGCPRPALLPPWLGWWD